MQEEDTELDTDMIKKFIKKLDNRDYIIILLIIMAFLVYMLMMGEIDKCNLYYQGIIEGMKNNSLSLFI